MSPLSAPSSPDALQVRDTVFKAWLQDRHSILDTKFKSSTTLASNGGGGTAMAILGGPSGHPDDVHGDAAHALHDQRRSLPQEDVHFYL